MGAEVPGDSLGDEFKGYIFKITGGNDKQGFPMKQGVMAPNRVRLLLATGHSCYRPRRTGERKRKSVRGCITGMDLSVLALAVVKQGEADIPGLTDVVHPKRLGPKRATKIRRFFGLTKDDDVCLAPSTTPSYSVIAYPASSSLVEGKTASLRQVGLAWIECENKSTLSPPDGRPRVGRASCFLIFDSTRTCLFFVSLSGDTKKKRETGNEMTKKDKKLVPSKGPTKGLQALQRVFFCQVRISNVTTNLSIK